MEYNEKRLLLAVTLIIGQQNLDSLEDEGAKLIGLRQDEFNKDAILVFGLSMQCLSELLSDPYNVVAAHNYFAKIIEQEVNALGRLRHKEETELKNPDMRRRQSSKILT